MNQQDYQPQEIDLRVLLGQIWATRRSVVLAGILASVVFWVFMAVVSLSEKPVYAADVNLRFDGIESLQYPNGDAFNSNDLLAAGVLENVILNAHLQDKYKTADSLRRDLSVSHFSPHRAFIIESFSRQARDKKLTIAELGELRKKLEQNLEIDGRSTLRLVFSPGLGIDEEVGSKVLQDVLKTWQLYEVEKKGAMSQPRLASLGFSVDADNIRRLDYLMGMEQVQRYVDLLSNSIKELIAKYPNALTVRGGEQQQTLPELLQAVTDFNTYQVERAFLPAKQHGLSRSVPDAVFYFDNLIKINQDQQALVQAKIAATERSLETYRGYSAAATQQLAAQPVASEDAVVPHLSGGFFDKLINLGERSSDRQFRQEISQAVLQHEEALATLKLREARLQRFKQLLLDSVSGPELLERYKSEMDESIAYIAQELTLLAKAVKEIEVILATQKFGKDGLAYEMVLMPQSVKKLLNKTTIRNFVLFVFCIMALVFICNFLVIIYRDGDEA